jgi:hypothetical protein
MEDDSSSRVLSADPTFSGFTKISEKAAFNSSTNRRAWVYYKKITDATSEPAQYSFTVSYSTAGVPNMAGVISRFSDVDFVSPINANSIFDGETTSTTLTFNGVTTTTPNSMLVLCGYSYRDVTPITYAAGTKISDATMAGSSSVANRITSTMAYLLQSSSGSSGNKTATIGATARQNDGLIVALTPAANGITLVGTTNNTIYANSSNVIVYGLGLDAGAFAKLVYANQEILMVDYVANSTQPYFTSPSLSDVFASRILFTDSANLQILNAQSGIVATKIVSFQPDANVKLVHNVIDSSESSNPGSIYYGQSPAITVSDQIVYDKKSSLLANVSIDSLGYFSIDYSNTTIGNDSFGYRVFETTSQVWGTEGIISTIVPTDVISRAFRVMKSLDGKRYSRYTDGSGPRYAATIIVRNQQQLNSALSLSNTALSGQVIGVEYNTTPYFIDDTIISDKSFASGLTICHYGSRMPEFNFIKIKGLVNTKISGIDLYKPSNGTCFIINSGTENFTLEYSKIHSTYWDPNGNYGAYEPSANQASGMTLSSSGAGANITNIYIMNNQIYNVLEGFTSGPGYTGDFHFIGNEVYNMYTGGLVFAPKHPNTGTTKINWNVMYSPYGRADDPDIDLGTPPHVDFIQPRVVRKNWTLELIGNILFPGNSRGGDECQCIFMDDNHISGFEFTSGGTYQISAGDKITGAISGANATIHSVDLVSGTWAGGDAAGQLYYSSKTGTFQAENLNVGVNINVATLPTGTIIKDESHFYTANVIGNLCITNSPQAISVIQSKNSRIIGNSILPASNTATIGARVNIGTGTASYPNGDGGGNIVKNTVAERINGSVTETNNYEYNSYSAAVLATLFVGPIFYGVAWYSKANTLSASAMLVGGSLDQATNIGSVGTGYVDFTARTINTAME